MPAVLNVAANLAFGGALAWVTRTSPAQRREFASWVLLLLVGFEALVVTPAATFLFRFYPQWSMLYIFDPQVFTELDNWIGGLSLLAVAANFGAAILGFHMTRRGMLAGRRMLYHAPWAVAAVIALVVLVLFGDRVVFMGDYDAFWQGNADLLLVRFGGWVGLLLYAGGGVLLWWVRRHFADHDPSLV